MNKIPLDKNLEHIKRLRYIDDVFMRACLKDNPKAVALIIKIILSLDNLTLTSINTQSDLKNLYGRSVILDVHAVDKDNKEYAIEFQRASAGTNPQRTRHISALLDSQILKSGMETKDMPESYVVLISENDVFNDKDRAVYAFDRYDVKNGKITPLNDGSHIVYVNGEYEGEDAIGKLIHDLLCENPDQMYYNELSERAKHFKQNEKGVKEMGSVIDEIREEGLEMGREEGRVEGRIEGRVEGRLEGRIEGRVEGAQENSKSTAIRLIQLGKNSLEDIAEVTQLPFEDIQKLQAQILQPT